MTKQDGGASVREWWLYKSVSDDADTMTAVAVHPDDDSTYPSQIAVIERSALVEAWAEAQMYHQCFDGMVGERDAALAERDVNGNEIARQSNRAMMAEHTCDTLRAEVAALKTANTHLSTVDKRSIGDIILERDKLRTALERIASGQACSACSCDCHAVAKDALGPQEGL